MQNLIPKLRQRSIISKRPVFRQNTWFLENNRTLSKFLYDILHYWISIFTLYIIKSVHKKQFYTNHASHLKEKNFLHKTFSILCKQLLPLVFFDFQNKLWLPFTQAGLLKDTLIKAQAICTILSRVINFSVPSPFDNK